MNDESSQGLESVANDALEARLVSWVLGEASAFEASESEKLYQRDREVRLFVDRLRLLDGLIKEEQEEVWRLPVEKRAAVLALIEDEVSVVPGRSNRRWWSIAAAAVVMMVAIGGALAPMATKRATPMAKEVSMVAPHSASVIDRYSIEPGIAQEFYAVKGYEPPELPNEGALDGIIISGNRSGDGLITRNSVNELMKEFPVTPATPTDSGPEDVDTGLIASAESEGMDGGGGGVNGEDPFASSTVEDSVVRRKSAPKPSASHAAIIGANTVSPMTVPVPAVPAPAASLAFGDGDDFGEGWGVGGSHEAEATKAPRYREIPVSGNLLGIDLDDDESTPQSELDRRLLADPFAAGGVTQGEANRDLRSLAEKKPDSDTVPDGTSPERNDSRSEDLDDVRQGLYRGQGHYDLGQLDEAKKQYEEVLKTDPTNTAARRGMERVAASKDSYYRAAYDQTRAELLEEVDAAWELAVPTDEDFEGFANYGKRSAGDVVEGGGTHDSLMTRTIVVPSDFVSRLAASSSDSSESDPFAAPDETVGALPRMSMQELLKQHGVSFGPHSAVQFFAGKSTIMVTNTPSNLDLVEQLATSLAAESSPDEPLVRMDEVSAADEPFSTFSLHVSDTSFKLTSAAMERGEVPEPESIRPEEFYNAFDYGDPAPAADDPVACVLEQSAHPAFPQRSLMRVAVRTGSAGRANATPLNLTLLLDNSGSMEREDRAQGVSNAVEQLATLLQPGDKVTVAGFSRKPRLLVDRLDGGQAAQLNGMVAQLPAEGGTNLEEALVLGEELAKRQFVEGAQNRVVLFTDGAANLGDADPESLNDRIEMLRQHGIAFDAAGFGADGLNDRLLERLTRNGNGRYYVVDDPADADTSFANKLAGAFRPEAENVKVQVVFNPSRVGNYKLIGFEKHRLKKEDFRNDSVDAAELASEEAGVALYQFEVLPEGEGEIGEVSVRFRDVATGQMVERTWTIPYDSAAPAFDQAAESLQLAALAAFAAEKLRSAPLAEVVDLKELAPVMGRVSARYSDDPRIAQLRRMIEQLR